MIFFQLVDNILEAINSRLHQKNIQFYVDAKELILSSACKPVESLDERATFTRRIGAVCDHFGSDLDVRSLTLQLEMLYDLMDGKSASSLSDITAALTTLGPAKRLYSQLSKLITLLLVIPATSATAERSFSCVRRLKTSAQHYQSNKTKPSAGSAYTSRSCGQLGLESCGTRLCGCQ